MKRYIVAALIALAPSMPRMVGACLRYPTDGGPHALDPVEAGDNTPPSTPVVDADVWPESHSGCGGSGCGHPSLIHLTLRAPDDGTPPDHMGYKFAVTSGTVPHGLALPTGALRSEFDGTTAVIAIRFDDDAPSGWEFDLEVTAVDLNGNESEPFVITIDG